MAYMIELNTRNGVIHVNADQMKYVSAPHAGGTIIHFAEGHTVHVENQMHEVVGKARG